MSREWSEMDNIQLTDLYAQPSFIKKTDEKCGPYIALREVWSHFTTHHLEEVMTATHGKN